MPSVIATMQALVVEQQAVIVDLRATIVRLEERVRDLETRVGSIRETRPGLRRPTCRARPSTRHPDPGAGDAVANPVTSPTSKPWRHPNGLTW